MLKTERQEYIMELIRRQRYVRVTELKTLLAVSDETIRRDLASLEKQGQLYCVHGGAVFDSSSANEYQVDVRARQNQAEKDAICCEASRMVRDGQSLAIAASTTTAYLGEYLGNKNDLTVVTNSVVLAEKIAANESNHVHLVGGEYWPKERKTMGARAMADFRSFNVDLCFFSASGISPEGGVTEYGEVELELTRSVLDSSRQIVLLNDYTKFDLAALRTVCGLEQLDAVVTDWRTPADIFRKYTELGLRMIRAHKL